MAESTVTSKGQITIPAEVRQAMGLMPQDRVVFTMLPDGTTVMRAKTRSALELSGKLKNKSRRKVAIRNMRIGR